MSTSFLFPVTSVPAVNFLEALAQNAATAMNNLGMPGPFKARDYIIRAIEVTTVDNFGPELNFFATAAGATGVVGTDTFIARFAFLANTGEQIAAAGVFRYYKDSLAIPYTDLDTVNTPNAGSVHVIVQNIAAAAKSAGATMKVTIWLEPQQAY